MTSGERAPFLTDFDLHLLAEGVHYRSYEKLGAHPVQANGRQGTHFAVWAPNADSVSVVGDFNRWEPTAHPMQLRREAGIWEVFIPAMSAGTLYKYHVRSRHGGYAEEKADPYAFASEIRPRTASRVCDLSGYDWDDARWMADRASRQGRDAPMSIYEVHLGSWMREPGEGGSLTYRDLAHRLADYLSDMGFTHVELMPIAEHPLDESWGYQTVGYFAPTSRFGPPQEFMALVDILHQRGVGVILDWAPAHFPRDAHGLAFFDGTHLYEHADPRQREHPHWGTLVFNYGRREVSNFLVSSALFWLEQYHIDGLRVDAVASMLYLDYGRDEGEWIPNVRGGNENLEAVAFVRRLNEKVYEAYPDVMTAAEESTAWPMVTRPTDVGGLGFGYKWNMGWMNDVLDYMSKDPIHRTHHHDRLTFSLVYAFNENFILPLSHDEVVHGKGSLLAKMPGDEWAKHANLRLLYGFMFGHPGKQLLFMGAEFGQQAEWKASGSLDWHLLESPRHEGLQRWVRDLNRIARTEPALHEVDFEPEGFEWIDCDDRQSSVLSFLRRGRRGKPVLVIANFTPAPRHRYRVGVPEGGEWGELLNSDAPCYGGSGVGNAGQALALGRECHGRPCSLDLTLPPLGVLFLKPS